MTKDTGLSIERGIHRIVMIFTAALIVFGACFAFEAIFKMNKGKNADTILALNNENEKGAARPLPDFIVDTLKPNELGQLKP
ncbi:MAG: hypothetical protein COA45_11150 [Zetaproteobacteria bacterium]|nr:MAG: hypothetical protein COA45_11150 [Zetaproteobacteria bacterium]